jgi:hypothetical protein
MYVLDSLRHELNITTDSGMGAFGAKTEEPAYGAADVAKGPKGAL